MIRGDARLVEYICQAYGLGYRSSATLVPVARGAVGQIWRLELGVERYAVKGLFWAPEWDSVRREVASTSHFTAAGIRLPASLASADGRIVVERPVDLGGGWWRVYEWIDGNHVDPADRKLAEPLGELLGRLHEHALPADGEVGWWYESTPEPERWPALVEAALTQDVAWAPELAERVPQMLDLAELVTPANTDRLITCHRDLHPENVLLDEHGVLVPLDWDDVGPVCPDRELARLVLDWLVHDDGTVDVPGVRRTLKAYRQAGGSGWLRDERSFGLVIATSLNFLHGQVDLALHADTAPEHREHAAKEITGGLARLPTRALLGELLEVSRSL